MMIFSDPVSVIDSRLVIIPAGEIELRDDRINKHWRVIIEPFLLSKFQVTQELYFDIAQQNPSTFKGAQKPVETLSWREAIIFCNLLSIRTGLKPCYILSETNELITFDEKAPGYRLPT